MKNTLIAFTLIGVSAAHASSCGDVAFGVYNLANDLVCSGPGLVAGASNTTINLNGHSIKCIGNGSQGSCQQTIAGGGGGGAVGIQSTIYNHVVVNGPGTVSGFAAGISLSNGYAHAINNVLVTGPSGGKIGTNDKNSVYGIKLYALECQAGVDVTGLPVDALQTQIINNEVSNQTSGMWIYQSGCITASGNKIHNNTGAKGGLGIVLVNSRRVNLYTNTVDNNGANIAQDGGILLLGPSTTHNVLYGNTTNYNCGYGIWGLDGQNGNNVISNHSRFNGQSTTDGLCAVPPPGQYTDLASFSQGSGNSWNPNNQCRTQSGQIPVGVCNPGE